MANPLDSYSSQLQRVIGIIGTKQAIGTTTSALAIAASASHSGNSPLVIEGNAHRPKVHEHLGIIPIQPSFEPLSFNFHELVHIHSSGIQVLPHHTSVFTNPAGQAHLEQVFTEAKSHHQLIIIPHTPHANMSYTKQVLSHINEVLFVTDDSHAGIARLGVLKELAKANKHTILGVVLSRVKAPEVVADYIERTTGLTVVANIPEDSAVSKARDAYLPLTVYSHRSPASSQYGLLARKIL